MTERETSDAAAALLAQVLAKGQAPFRFAGGGPAIGSQAEWLIFTALTDYLARHPDEQHRLKSEHWWMAQLPSSYPTSAPALVRLLDENYRHGNEEPGGRFRSNWSRNWVEQRCDFTSLEARRSDVASLARFSQRVDHATFYLYVAVDGQVERSHWSKPGVSVRKQSKSWYGAIARDCFARWRSTRELLVFDWSLSDVSEPLYRDAFWSLCELTPADSQLKTLFEHDRFRACRELVRHVDAYADQLALATDLAETLAVEEDDATKAVDQARLSTIQERLLGQAGERLSLTGAARRLGISRQALHKKIKNDTALGLMVGDTFVVPSAQFVEDDGGTHVASHLRDVLSLFSGSGAGTWSALQFLIEPDPVLGEVPLDMLKAGKHEQVVAITRAYLGLDEG